MYIMYIFPPDLASEFIEHLNNPDSIGVLEAIQDATEPEDIYSHVKGFTTLISDAAEPLFLVNNLDQ